MKRVLTISVAVAGLAAPCQGGDINVRGDWPTIQAAINNSMPGDEIVVQPGVYDGSIDTFGNSLTIRSSTGDPADVTIRGDDDFAVYVASFETTTIQGLSC